MVTKSFYLTILSVSIRYVTNRYVNWLLKIHGQKLLERKNISCLKKSLFELGASKDPVGNCLNLKVVAG